MPTITTDVDFDLDNIDDYELIDELESRGYDVIERGRSDEDLIEILEGHGFTVYGTGHKPNITRYYVEKLYDTYKTMSPEFFQKELKKFFREHLETTDY
jgi:hypothetical protein